jgi:CBS domain-containing protein
MGTQTRHEGTPGIPGDGLLVADVMVRDTAAISPETPIHQAARLMLERAVPGLPVIDGRAAVIGVLGEHDLLARLGPPRSRPWWHLLVESEQLALEYRKAVGGTVAEVMTHPAVTVSPTAPLETVIRLFDDEVVDLVPVLLGRRLVGAVSRPGLVGVLAQTPGTPIGRPDAEIVADMQARIAREVWISKPGPSVEARDGVVTLWGITSGEVEKAALVTMAYSVPGCRAVEDRLVAKSAAYRYHEMV